jgi:putative transposase
LALGRCANPLAHIEQRAFNFCCETLTFADGLFANEGLAVRKRRSRRKAVGTRAPILIEAKPNARWSLDFVHDQLACGRRFRILNIVDDVTRECLAAIPDTSISGRRVTRELATLIGR